MMVVAVSLYAVTAPSFERLRQQGNPIIAQIEKYHSQHGAYPMSAADAEIKLPLTRYGRWNYVAWEAGRSCQLSVGEYDGLKPFVLFWHSKHREWYLDQ
jgi:hypothetical protein